MLLECMGQTQALYFSQGSHSTHATGQGNMTFRRCDPLAAALDAILSAYLWITSMHGGYLSTRLMLLAKLRADGMSSAFKNVWR